ncbi:cytochrome c maturation protein CcmE [Hahella ganghwensis]|uniref:cytochrome c maturation protein CcmE n=1 Tax=Hahella ganghwensis TaxID=286420 RepID=UPI0003720384|nr:cytochrome c maturation protein CcmE [Hahella ganghwensis]
MNPKRKQRLLAVTFIVFGVGAAVGLALFALSQNINLFFNPTQVEAGEAPVDQRIRVGGMVVEGSVNRDPNSLAVTFDLTDYQGVVTVAYTGILPDLFREGQGIVTQGRLDAEGIFQADEVLAKHDENYMPPEIQRAVDKANRAETSY